MTTKVRVLLLRLTGLLISVALVWRLVDWQALAAIALRLAPSLLAFVVVCALFRAWLSSLRWKLMDPDPGDQLRHWDYFRYVMVGAVFNLFLPGALGGDLVRSILVVRELDSHRGSGVAAIAADRMLGLFSILVLGSVACIIAPGLEGRFYYLAVLIPLDVAFIFGCWVAVAPKLNHALMDWVDRPGRAWSAAHRIVRTWSEIATFYRKNPGHVGWAILLCIPIHFSWFLIVYLIARAIGIEVSFLGLAMVTSLAWLITALPISFGGLGVRELSFIYLLSIQGVDPESSALLGICQFGVIVATSLIGVPMIWMGKRIRAVPVMPVNPNAGDESGEVLK